MRLQHSGTPILPPEGLHPAPGLTAPAPAEEGLPSTLPGGCFVPRAAVLSIILDCQAWELSHVLGNELVQTKDGPEHLTIQNPTPLLHPLLPGSYLV